MAILKIEELHEVFQDLNDFSGAEEIFNENETLGGIDPESYYNERIHSAEFFKRYTVSIENAGEFNEWKNKLGNEYWYLDGQRDDLAMRYRREDDEEVKSKMTKEHEKLGENMRTLRDLQREIKIENWKENKTPKGQKIGKFLKRLGVRQDFLDWQSTQEKSNSIVQVTINPTVQAIAGMSNFAERGSWNGHNGTSCQDTRHSEGYTRCLVGAISDNTMFSVQLNYLDDNTALGEHIQVQKELGASLEEAIESYNIEDNIGDDILYSNNFQDNLKARTLVKIWELHKQERSEADTSELSQALEDLRKLGLEMNIAKTIRFYGSDKTRAELKDALEQVALIDNVLVDLY